MTKISKKLVAAFMIGIMLFAVSSIQVLANTGSSAHVTVTVNASRPVVGNPRGTATTRNRNMGGNGIRARTVIINSNGFFDNSA